MSGPDIKSPFDDDSHTFEQGPIPRFYRMRKWFFATGASLLLLETGWLDFAAVAQFFAVPGLPPQVAHAFLTVTGVYLIVQAVAVLVQIQFTYPESIHARIGHFKTRKHKAYSDTIDQLEAELRGIDTDPPNGLKGLQERTRYQELSEILKRIREEAERVLPEQLRTVSGLEKSEAFLDYIRIYPTFFFLLYSVVTHGSVMAIWKTLIN